MIAVFKREFKNFFQNVIGWVFVAGIVVSLFIPFILKGSQKDSWAFIYTIYFRGYYELHHKRQFKNYRLDLNDCLNFF